MNPNHRIRPPLELIRHEQEREHCHLPDRFASGVLEAIPRLRRPLNARSRQLAELVPDEQRRKFSDELAKRQAGDEEAMPIDQEFILALEHGMPPAGGLGIGIDRLTMIFTGIDSIREVILFPLLKPEH